MRCNEPTESLSQYKEPEVSKIREQKLFVPWFSISKHADKVIEKKFIIILVKQNFSSRVAIFIIDSPVSIFLNKTFREKKEQNGKFSCMLTFQIAKFVE